MTNQSRIQNNGSSNESCKATCKQQAIKIKYIHNKKSEENNNMPLVTMKTARFQIIA
ncbi:MAG: hypothetical protein ACI8RD_012941 [Bacillariaceae sp.]|jgi:hypothetical protein